MELLVSFLLVQLHLRVPLHYLLKKQASVTIYLRHHNYLIFYVATRHHRAVSGRVKRAETAQYPDRFGSLSRDFSYNPKRFIGSSFDTGFHERVDLNVGYQNDWSFVTIR